ncbi:filamentous hemagglutinin N-terminal domain-containing protein [Candidatus Reidiella endopervernicosa]|uniref:Filamentous hemagglutinin N-terminal domain-containing protein n=1 Tax=Candidatus Reidiella endopervernicosa TaxID=2738883 RepID=A0A6N0HT40_9GAMM|nr:filamentous hemagglutinin N-terminal domain-containing protein [Candidatus Reidiella endopervernicosa]QKQ25386.1 filamentous hemagglutinin N-terminal domain-containing protein [Candidatus Reidiella endopervernicosa]
MSLNPGNRNTFCQRVVTMLAATLITVTTAQAAPSGGEVQAGSASITQNGSLTLIEQQSSRAVIDWRSFDVGVDEAVRFAQPGSDSATLNRVNSDQISVIMGRVDANGQLYLLNPNGVVIGEGANIDVGALVATTANIGNSDFPGSRYFAEACFGHPSPSKRQILNTTVYAYGAPTVLRTLRNHLFAALHNSLSDSTPT